MKVMKTATKVTCWF